MAIEIVRPRDLIWLSGGLGKAGRRCAASRATCVGNRGGYWGEEFVAVVLELNLDRGLELAEPVRQRLSAVQVERPEGVIATTVSAGVVEAALDKSFEWSMELAGAAVIAPKKWVETGSARLPTCSKHFRVDGKARRGACQLSFRRLKGSHRSILRSSREDEPPTQILAPIGGTRMVTSLEPSEPPSLVMRSMYTRNT
jgi:hypothetical protein